LKEQNTRIQTTIEWVEFSRHWSPDLIFEKVMRAIDRIHNDSLSKGSSAGAALGLAIAAFIFGMFLGGSSK